MRPTICQVLMTIFGLLVGVIAWTVTVSVPLAVIPTLAGVLVLRAYVRETHKKWDRIAERAVGEQDE